MINNKLKEKADKLFKKWKICRKMSYIICL